MKPHDKKFRGTWATKESSSLQRSFQYHLKYSQVKDQYSATKLDLYKSIALTVRDRLVEKWIKTQQSYYDNDVKRVYYFSMEFLIGKLLTNSLINLDFHDECEQALDELGYDLQEFEEIEAEAGLGNGGLGRLAACFLDSMATLSIPAYGYGIRYKFGVFYQKIVDGVQVEATDNWTRKGNPWEIPRSEYFYPVKFYGRSQHTINSKGEPVCEWVDTHDDVMAMAYDIPIPGFRNNTVNNLRLWRARSTRELDLEYFNVGNYVQAVQNKQETETISKVLYPSDGVAQGKELRLKQEYFFVSASLQDIIRRYKKSHDTFDQFSDKVAIQLNDTHPSLAIAELMRILVDQEETPWVSAWDICRKTFAFTNHTVLPEALEKWTVDLLGRLLPRHLEIIYEINRRFLDRVEIRFPGDTERLRRMSLIEEAPVKLVRMAHLAIVGSHSVNGVAELHTNILKTRVFRDFHEMFPDRFNNKTNGITPRRWLRACNPELARLISGSIGEGWITDLKELEKLPVEDDQFRERWRQVKKNNKKRLAEYILRKPGIKINVDTLFDVQIKRIHEYKRQLLNILHVITLYHRIKNNVPLGGECPRTVIFSGKAAPGYSMAKLIIELINRVAEKINRDSRADSRLKVVFIPNYSVAVAEKIIPAADLSEQISTPGTEASGTGNMKLALNGALTIGTLDGANIEIMEEVGEENIFIFGLKADAVERMQRNHYRPVDYYLGNDDLKETLGLIQRGFFNPSQPDLFHPIVDSLLHEDPYMTLADFAAYCRCQEKVNQAFQNTEEWTRKSILNAAHMGKFSSDRTVLEYAKEIWNVKVGK